MVHEHISADLSKYTGQLVVICNKKVIAHDKDLTNIEKDIDRCKTTPTLVRIPKEDILIL